MITNIYIYIFKIELKRKFLHAIIDFFYLTLIDYYYKILLFFNMGTINSKNRVENTLNMKKIQKKSRSRMRPTSRHSHMICCLVFSRRLLVRIKSFEFSLWFIRELLFKVSIICSFEKGECSFPLR